MKIAVFTGTRAEYGLLKWLITDINNHKDLVLQLLVSGTHLSPEFGETKQHIIQDGFEISEEVEITLSSNTPVGTLKSMGLGLIGYAESLTRMQPDVLVILGDRTEALAAAQAAMILRIPIAHIHGGELTEGAYDDAIRHSITKMSAVHFTSTEEHRNRVIQLGEQPNQVLNVGAVGLETFNRLTLMSLEGLSENLNFYLEKPFFLVTYHPETLGSVKPEAAMSELLKALDTFEQFQIIITYPNSDDGGRAIIPLIESYTAKQPERVFSTQSLGQLRYLSALKHAAAVIGNSSSGIIEAPSCNTPTINIGDRQKGRTAATSVLHCSSNQQSIEVSIKQAISTNWDNTTNPYGTGNSSKAILEKLLTDTPTTTKMFHDL